jgi:hypothetical protein
MFLPSEHFAAFVGYLEGSNEGTGGQFLESFGRWLGTPSIRWWGQIERKAVGRSEPPKSDMCERLSPSESRRCVELLQRELRQFLAEQA